MSDPTHHEGDPESRSSASFASAPAEFLKALFDALRAAGVRYAVLRNHEHLPESVGDSDLDLVVDSDACETVRRVLGEVMAAAGAAPIGFAWSSDFVKAFVLGRIGARPGRWWGLRVDINGGLTFRGIPYAVPDVVWSRVHERNGVRVLEPVAAAVIGVIKDLLTRGEASPSYLAEARAALARGEWECVAALLEPVGEDAVSKLRSLLAAPDPSSARRAARALQRGLARRALLASPVRFVARRARHEWTKIARLSRPPGLLIAFMGVDGVGKSTTIEAIMPALMAATHGAVQVQHLRPTLLPPLASFRGARPAGEPHAVVLPHGSAPSGALGSMVRLAYYTADYVVGYWVRVRPFIAKQPAIWVFDRYAYDMALDPRRFRVRAPTAIATFFSRLAPRPDLTVCLTAGVESILQRKQELPPEEVARQLGSLASFAEGRRNTVLVSTDGSVSDARDRVLETILHLCKARSGGAVEPSPAVHQ